MIPGTSALLSPFLGSLRDRIRPAHILAAGLFAGALGTFAISSVTPETGYLDLVWRLAIFGAAYAMMLTAASIAAINSVPPAMAGMAAATNSALRQIGAALGPAVLGTVYAVAASSVDGSPSSGLMAAMLTCVALLGVAAVAVAASDVLDRRSSRTDA